MLLDNTYTHGKYANKLIHVKDSKRSIKAETFIPFLIGKIF